jgi:hypothetical protein
MSTVLDLITGSLRLLQVKSSDAALTAEEANDALETLNELLESYVNAPYSLFKETREEITLPSSATSYTWGLGAYNINSEPPNQLISVRTSGSDVAVLSMDDFKADIHMGAYYYPSWPVGTLYYSGSAGEVLSIVSYKPLARYTNLSDTVDLPPGYKRMLKYNLALDLAPEYQTTAGQDVRMIAKEALTLIKRRNHRIPTSSVDPALYPNSPPYNVYTDTWI